MTRWTSPSRGLLFGALAVVFATSALVSGCDSPSTIGDPDPVDAVSGYDAAVVARAAALAADDDPFVRVPFTLAATDAPLLRFDDSDQFDEMATALETIARATGEPLAIHSDLAPYTGAEYDLSVPKGSLALADRKGRVVIGDQVYTLRRNGDAVEATVARTESGAITETIVVRAFDTEGRIETPGNGRVYTPEQVASGELDAGARIDPDAETVWLAIGPVQVTNKQGQARRIWTVYAHSDYTTWTGSKQANAQSEIVANSVSGSFAAAYEAKTSEFDYQVYGLVRTEHYGCKQYEGVSPTYNNARIYVNAGGSRGTGQRVYFSLHSSYNFLTGASLIHSGNYLLDGADNDADCRL